MLFSEFLRIFLNCTFNTFVFLDFRFTRLKVSTTPTEKPKTTNLLTSESFTINVEEKRRQQKLMHKIRKTENTRLLGISFWLDWTEKQSVQIRNLRNFVHL